MRSLSARFASCTRLHTRRALQRHNQPLHRAIYVIVFVGAPTRATPFTDDDDDVLSVYYLFIYSRFGIRFISSLGRFKNKLCPPDVLCKSRRTLSYNTLYAPQPPCSTNRVTQFRVTFAAVAALLKLLRKSG